MATPEYSEDALARAQAEPYENIQTQPQIEPQQRPETPVMPTPRKKSRVITRKEIVTFSLISVLAIILIFSSLITQVMISNQHRDLQDLQVSNQLVTVENSNLNQEVQELSRYSRIMEVAEELGLKMNEANVRNVSE